MKKILLLVLLFPAMLFSRNLVPAKDSIPDSLRTWHYGGLASLNLAQASYTDWAAGGVNSVSAQALFSGYLGYKKATTTWDNTLDLAYGILQQGKTDGVRKMDDKIDFTSKLGH
ncbi:MAG TPA: DUF3078 domain-containing protein, partial [Bacteroidia bacterium]|nr:DUF3078 domain-containing protein [Bacteroidia bacterium]